MKQGDKILLLPNKKGFSQDYMADKLGITQPAYGNIENNKAKKLSVDRLKELASIPQVNVEDIVNFDYKISI